LHVKKASPPPCRSQAQLPHQIAAAVGAPDGKTRQRTGFGHGQALTPAVGAAGGSGAAATARAYPIRAARTKHGTRQWGRFEFAQDAITTLFPDPATLPGEVNLSRLTRNVNNHLARDPEYRAKDYGKLSRQTVMRALEALRVALTSSPPSHLDT
jgi:hypothetical protein